MIMVCICNLDKVILIEIFGCVNFSLSLFQPVSQLMGQCLDLFSYFINSGHDVQETVHGFG